MMTSDNLIRRALNDPKYKNANMLMGDYFTSIKTSIKNGEEERVAIARSISAWDILVNHIQGQLKGRIPSKGRNSGKPLRLAWIGHLKKHPKYRKYVVEGKDMLKQTKNVLLAWEQDKEVELQRIDSAKALEETKK